MEYPLDAPFLTTKLFLPPQNQSNLERADLLAEFDHLLTPGIRFALVSAPAGYGKTSLTANWLRHAQKNHPNIHYAWYSLEESDNDPIEFLTYLLASIQTNCPLQNSQTKMMLESGQFFNAETACKLLTQDLLQVKCRLVIVLDDYHLIHNLAIHTGVINLIDHLPPQIRLIITTRSDPPFPCHRYRARAQMIELRQGDLRFSVDEINAYFNQLTGKDLISSELIILEHRTEGWPAGLHLAALGIKNSADRGEYLRSLSRSDQFIMDYLSEEVFVHQPEPIQQFLLSTSLLDQFCAPLCDSIENNPNPDTSESMLEYLGRSNLFLIPLDEDGRWFRYHHLFSDFLRRKLKRAGQAAHLNSAEIYTKAAQWFQAEGLVHLAIRYFLAANQFELAAKLVEQYTLQLFSQGYLTQLLSWIRLLPQELISTRPWLCVYQAWVLCFSGQNTQVAEWITKANLAAETSPNTEQIQIHYETTAIEAMVAVASGKVADALRMTENISEPPTNQQKFAFSVLLWTKAYAYRLSGNIKDASPLFKQVLDLGIEIKNTFSILSGSVDYGNSLRLLGQLDLSEKVFRTGYDLVQKTRQGQGFIGRLESFLANVLYEKNLLDEAIRYAKAGIDHNLSWENPNHRVYGKWVLARVLAGSGNYTDASRILTEAESDPDLALVLPSLQMSVQAARFRLLLRDHQIQAAQYWLQGLPAIETLSPEIRIQVELCSARLAIATDHPETAFPRLARIAEEADQAGQIPTAIESHLLAALSAPNASLIQMHIQSALQSGIPNGFVRVYLDEGEPAAKIISGWLNDQPKTQVSWIQKVTEVLQLFPPINSNIMKAPIQNTGLTAREIEILSFIAIGFTNREIGEKLFISPGTVKAHSASIFRKLDAPNRAAAVTKAKELGLI